MPDALALATALACLFFSVLFIQSGLDKVSDWKGNHEWLVGHFAKTRLAGLVTPMLGAVTVVELAAGVVSAVGAVMALAPDPGLAPTVGLGLSCLALSMLFFGQRVAKDYAGAATLATYFAVALAGLVANGLMARG
jgi:hypothetical protein